MGKEIFIEELKQIQLDITLKIDEFCRRNDIEYFLSAGTGIGAARHKGYIPWDDDIDLAMTRPNYEKFIHTFNGYDKNLSVYAPELDWNYYAPYANVCDNRTLLLEGANGHRGQEIGVKVDIFPIDGTTDNYARRVTRHVFSRLLKQILSRKRRDMSIVWRTSKWKFCTCLIVRTLFCCIRFSTLQKWIHHIGTKFPFETSTQAYNVVCTDCKLPVPCPRETFEQYINVPFEGHTLMTIKDYDTYLTSLFGNYMQLPPIEQRVGHHGFTAYWKD